MRTADEYVAQARENFLAGYNCAQSVLLAFAKDIGETEEHALLLASPFGAGMGRLRQVCGALSAAFFVEGALRGYTDPKDVQAKAELYARVQDLAHRFEGEMGSILCGELLGPGASTSPVPEARTPAYYTKRPCARCIECGARLAAEILMAKKTEET
jgi:C_GCAxxG_C_C family probable redox protein